jgi:hypothetical protein
MTTVTSLADQFDPPRRKGIILHGVIALGLIAGCGVSLWLAMRQDVGSYFVLLLLLALVLFAPLFMVLYRAYALLQGRYAIERNGVRIRWGLRAEDIPLPDIEWVRPASDLVFNLPLPILPMPGAIIGTRNVEGLGVVEFLASESKTMLLIATPNRVFAISPANPNAFMRSFQRIIELGSLTPLRSYSTLPAAYLQGVWSDLAARILVLVGLVLTLALFVYVSLLIPTLPAVSLGYEGNGLPVEPGPPQRLLLWPVLAALAFITDLVTGLFFYRRPDQRAVAYLIWGSSCLTPILLMVATLFIQ